MAEEKLTSRPMSPRPAKLVVRFDQQQLKLLDALRAEGTFGTDNGDIIRNVVLDYLAQQKRQAEAALPGRPRQQSRTRTQRKSRPAKKGRSKP